MKKLDKYIQKANFVKVYIGDAEGQAIRHFEGVVFSYSDDYVFMCDLSDFNYDGLVVFRKADIIEVRYSENEVFFEKILKAENILRSIRLQKRENPFRVGTLKRMLEQLEKLKIPVIFECLYDEEEKFQIGPIESTHIDKIKITYFNSAGEFDEKPVEINFTDITFLRFDSPYANLFYKYTDKTMDYAKDEPDVIMEVDDEEAPKKAKKSKAKKSKVKKEKVKKEKVLAEEEVSTKKEKKDKKKSKKKESTPDKKKKKKSSKKDKDDKKKSKKDKKSKDKKSKDKKSKKNKSKDKKSKKSKKDKSTIKNKKVKKSKKGKKKSKKK